MNLTKWYLHATIADSTLYYLEYAWQVSYKIRDEEYELDLVYVTYCLSDMCDDRCDVLLIVPNHDLFWDTSPNKHPTGTTSTSF